MGLYRIRLTNLLDRGDLKAFQDHVPLPLLEIIAK
jgi:hypothetical protein